MLMENKVLETTKKIIENPKYVKIDYDKINELSEEISKEKLEIPSWRAPVFLEENNKDTIQSFFLGNSINFAFSDLDSPEHTKYETIYNGKSWRGSFGMWACLKRSLEEGIPILDAEYLQNVPEKDMEHIFRGNIKLPLFNERVGIFREMGEVLNKKYGGSFYNLTQSSGNRLFNNGNGLIERLIRDFPSFDDSDIFNGEIVRFDKRAQLAPGMLYGRFRNQGIFKVSDVHNIAGFADYVLPKAFRDMDVISYESSLANKVDNQELIEAGSQEELEIRASTIHVMKAFQDNINNYRKHNPVNVLHLDYKFWSKSKNKTSEGSPHHLTKTTAY